MQIKHIEQLKEQVIGQKKRVAIALGEDAHTLQAVIEGVKEGLFTAVNFARKGIVEETASTNKIDLSLIETVNVSSELEGIEKAVKEVHEGRANVLMKGICSSANYLRGVLNKEWGLLPEGALLSNVSLVEVSTYDKLLLISDPGVLLKPSLEDKIQQIRYCVAVAKKIGIEEPKVAILSAVETVTSKIQSTIDAAIISQMAQRGQIKDCVIDGPLSMDLAISSEAKEIKHFDSPVAGNADIIIFPDIETGNVVYKSLTKLCNAKTAGILLGTTAPCVIPSRGDSMETKFLSLLFAASVS
ncbi:MAG: phosphate acyltransferase [Caldisericaceae bacterium]